MRRRISWCWAWLAWSGVALAVPPTWTQADLDAAAADGQWHELLEHASDVAPVSRTDTWRAQVSKALTHELSQTRPDVAAPFASMQAVEGLLKRYPFVEKSAEFSQARDAALTASYQTCLGSSVGDCERRLLAAASVVSPRTALRLAKLLRGAGVFAYGPMPLVRHAVAQDASLCADPQVKEATLAALATPADGALAVAAKEVAFERCFGALQPALKGGFQGASTYYFENVCRAMRQKKMLSELQSDLCEDAGQ